jgi:dTDP-4-amino-4,6-dideoxygalactose transaminase
MRDTYLVFGSPQILEDEIEEVVAALRSGWIGTGPRTARFEEDFRAYTGAAHSVAVNSCTAALHLAMVSAGIGPGDEVITTPLTFCATVNGIIHAGGTPVLADVDPVSMNIDPEAVAAKITPRTKAVIPVHFGGRPCNMDALCALAAEHNLEIIEDCAHAVETRYKGRAAGTMGSLGCFSFYVTKNVMTGEGGMVLTEDAERAARIKRLALHGMSADAWKRFSDDGYKHYMVVEAGFKYNMTDMQAALGIHQLARVEENLKKREAVWARYDEAFAELPLILPAPPEADTRHARHLYTILVDEAKTGISRDAFLLALHKRNIGTGVHYISMVEHPYYQERFGWSPADCPQAARIGRQTMSLPLSPKLREEDVADVIEAVRAVLRESM